MSDRIFGLIVITGALAYIASAFQIAIPLFPDPVGPKTFPIVIGGIMILAALSLVLRPDDEPEWPGLWTLGRIGIAVVVLVAYAMTIRPLGFLVPTAFAAGLLSYQIQPRATQAAITGVCLSGGLFVVFKYALGLGLFAVPQAWLG